jgi:hypothetical protein
MSAFQTRAQKRASKAKSLRNEKIQRFVADQMKEYDTSDALKASQTREQFLALVTNRAQTSASV